MFAYHVGRAEFAIEPRHVERGVAERLLQEEDAAVVQQYHGEPMAESASTSRGGQTSV